MVDERMKFGWNRRWYYLVFEWWLYIFFHLLKIDLFLRDPCCGRRQQMERRETHQLDYPTQKSSGCVLFLLFSTFQNSSFLQRPICERHHHMVYVKTSRRYIWRNIKLFSFSFISVLLKEFLILIVFEIICPTRSFTGHISLFYHWRSIPNTNKRRLTIFFTIILRLYV